MTEELWLQHPDRLRTAVFTPVATGIRLRKKVGFRWVSDEILSEAVAAERIRWYRSLGYEVW